MDIIAKIAEEKIRAAMERGEFDNLPGRGKPLILDDDAPVPEENRLAYKVLKNAGCIPPELEMRKEALSLRELIDTIDDEKERLKKIRELDFLIMKIEMERERSIKPGPYREGFILRAMERKGRRC